MAPLYAIGIDLGTTYSCVGVWRNNTVEIIANNIGKRTTPSIVSFTEKQRLIGNEALHKAGMNVENTVFNVKRLMGRDFNDPEVQSDIKYWPFKIIEKHGKPYIQVKYKREIENFTPEQISSMILSKMKDIASDYLDQDIVNAVITVPAYFNDSQRKATIDAGKIAGLNVLRIISEPTAAAIAYGLNKELNTNINILVVDLGGGTLDISLLNLNNGTFEVKATAGDTHLGGEDFTNRLVDYFVKEFKEKYNEDISSNPRSLYRLKEECERAKRELSSVVEVDIDIPYLYNGIDFESKINRARFEKLNDDLFEQIIVPLKSVLECSNLKKEDIHDIVLVGGSTRIPKIQDIVSSYFDNKIKLKKSINPDEAVAYGASVQASILNGEISERIENIALLDVTPLSLGTDIIGGIMDTIIERNSPIPIRKTKEYFTIYDNQTSVSVQVYEGERALLKDNKLLGEFFLDGITPAPRGETKINVTFDIDKNGILNVKASEKGTGIYKKITITNNKGRLYEKEINDLINIAQKFKEDDKKIMERITSKNNLEEYAYNLRKLINNERNASKINTFNKNRLIKAINSTIEWIKSNQNANKEEYDSVKEYLENISIPITLM